MAYNPAADVLGWRRDGVRSVDHLETGLRRNTKPYAGRHRLGVHVPRREVSNKLRALHAGAVVAVASVSTGGVAAIFIDFAIKK